MTAEDGPAPPSPLAELESLGAELPRALAAIASRAEWERAKGEWSDRLDRCFALLKSAPAELRPALGKGANELKNRVKEGFASRGEALEREAEERRRRAARVDVTLPGRLPARGAIHPISLAALEIEEIFRGLGYSVAEGPEAEEDRYNFELLNFPADHPARDAQDTLFLADGRLLRTHTSPVQIRTMLSRRPPIRVICPGRVYRNDNDLRHSPMFHQVEGLCVAEGITVGDLKGTLLAFVRQLFAADTEVRLRPSYFPFTEPSCEVDITCQICKGAGCATCSGTGWMEILGAGMVDPRVLENCGIDPDRYSGFAFGLGIDRVAMNQWGIGNIRTLFENDERILRQVTG